jgi:hypothetical protein
MQIYEDSGQISEGYYLDNKRHGPFRFINKRGDYWFAHFEDGLKNGTEHYVLSGGDTI